MALTSASFALQCFWKASSTASSSPPPPPRAAPRMTDRSRSVRTAPKVASISSAVGTRPSARGRLACPGAATSTPHIATGSEARTTKSPSCETLKLKLGAWGSAIAFARKGLRPRVRAMTTSGHAMPATLAHAARCSRRLTSARFLSITRRILSTSSRS